VKCPQCGKSITAAVCDCLAGRIVSNYPRPAQPAQKSIKPKFDMRTEDWSLIASILSVAMISVGIAPFLSLCGVGLGIIARLRGAGRRATFAIIIGLVTVPLWILYPIILQSL